MPKIPVYEKQVDERGIPSPQITARADPDAFNAGQSFNNVVLSGIALTRTLADAAERERERADRAIQYESEAAVNRFENENLYDPGKGLFRTLGKDSFGIKDQISERSKKFADEHRKTLNSPRQREAFDRILAERSLQWDRAASNHIANQTDIVERASRNARVESFKDRAALRPDTINEALVVLGDTVREEMQGQSEEAIAEKMKEQVTDLHSRVVKRYLANGDDVAALKHLEGYSGSIDEDREADLRDQIKMRQEQLRKESVAKTEMAALNLIEKTGDFGSLPQNVVEALPRESRSALRNYAKTVAKGDEIETDRVAYHELATMPDKEFKEVNLFAYKDKLSDADWKHFSNRKEKVLKGKGDPDGFDGIRTEIKIVNDTLEANGFRSNPDPKKNREEAEDVANYWKAVEHNVIELQKRTGKKASPDDVQKIADDLMLKVKTGTSNAFSRFFRLPDKTEPLFKVEKLSDIPPADVADIKAMVKQRKGVEPTDEQILRIYQKTLAGEQNGR